MLMEQSKNTNGPPLVEMVILLVLPLLNSIFEQVNILSSSLLPKHGMRHLAREFLRILGVNTANDSQKNTPRGVFLLTTRKYRYAFLIDPFF
ncbi:MAG: hypothetical protein ACI83D_000262 [Planctomycetota bacterium]